MKFYLLLLLLIGCSFGSKAQLNMTFKSRLDYAQLHDARLSSIWGYVDEVGNEYALVGTSKGTSIVNVTNPLNPVELVWIPGEENIWREIKTFGNYAYVSTEADEGVLIIDLSPLPQSNNLSYSYFTGNNGVNFSSVHTLWIDQGGYLYLFGANYGTKGGIICDLNVSMTNPPVVRTFSETYIHDGIVNGDKMYTGHILDGYFRIYDVTDKTNPIFISEQITPHSFTHNVAPTPDNRYAFTTDERANAFIAAYDVSDPLAVREVDRIRSTEGTAIIPHNVHYKSDNFLVTSYYTDGVIIHDVTYPYNMVKVGSYDTSPSSAPDFSGCWGVYPYFPSGNIVASDIELGLFVIAPNYKRAGYLEGIIYNATTNDEVDDVSVEIIGRSKRSNEDGFYAIGTAEYGATTVSFTKLGYHPYTTTVNFTEGVKVELDVYLVPLDLFDITINVVDDETDLPVLEAYVALDHISNGLSYEALTNGIGSRTFQLSYEDFYDVSVSLWGYRAYCDVIEIDQQTNTIEVRLVKGYLDNFRSDLGWITTSTALTGHWTRAIPYESQGGANPGFDSPDCGKYAFVTGNSTVFGIIADDVNGGTVRLISPVMDLRTFDNPHINFYYWFYNFYGEGPLNDKMVVKISNGESTVLVTEIFGRESLYDMFEWRHLSLSINGLLEMTENMQVIFEVSDEIATPNVVEAGVDHFSISNANTTAVDVPTNHELTIYPNPFTNRLTIDHPEWRSAQLLDVQGKSIVLNWENEQVLNTNDLTAGIYFLSINGQVSKVVKR